MSNRVLLIVLGFIKQSKQPVSINQDNDFIAKAVAYNMALSDIAIFLEQLIDNKVSPEKIKALLKEREWVL